eukprot:scaffold3054_cov129-Cylindrotheca_fusiformis.AAC.4
MKLPTSIKVYYADYAFWRAEVLRAGLYLQDIPFENVTEMEILNDLKANGLAPFGAFPVMEVDGEILSQTQACASYVGKLGDMYPSNEDTFAQAKCDEIINGCTDVTETIAVTIVCGKTKNWHSKVGMEDPKEAREKLMDPNGGRLHMLLTGLNSIMCKDGSEFVCGKDYGLTVADLAVWRMVDWLSWGKLDHIPVDYVMSFPNLKKVYSNVEQNEKIQAYLKEYYPGK